MLLQLDIPEFNMLLRHVWEEMPQRRILAEICRIRPPGEEVLWCLDLSQQLRSLIVGHLIFDLIFDRDEVVLLVKAVGRHNVLARG